MDAKKGQVGTGMDAQAGQPPLKDFGSFVITHAPSDADIKDHRSQETVYIGLRLPKQSGSRHRHKRHKHRPRRVNGDKTSPSQEAFKEDSAPPSQRVQFLLGEDEDDEHRAHDLFCEMEELYYGPNGEMEWKESARWIKFEEDVEEGGERWSKPHVATLSLHSLFELRCHIMTGTVMLDIEPYDLSSVVDLIIDNMVASKQLEENLKEQVRDVLLIRHRHLNQKRPDNGGSKYHLPLIRSLADIGKKHSEPKSMHLHGEDKEGHKHHFPGAKSTPNFAAQLKRDPSNPKIEHNATHAGNLLSNNSSADLLERDSSHKNLHFMKKIPQGAEAGNILVGEVDFLTHPIVGYVRLLKSVFMPDLTEVPVPSKFIFIMLGPIGKLSSYHEIGRSIATLMSDEVFHDVAYHAKNREDILAGIDEFLDQVTVLPPGEWDPSIRIEPPKSIPSQESRKTPAPPMPNGKAPGDTEEEESHADPGLVRTGRLFGGLIDDIKRKWSFYPSDFKDAFHIQSLASFFFLYFACLTPIITFGGLLGDATKNNLAAIESLLAGAICGVVYALFSGQPLTILGSTGPILVYETILYDFCKDNHWDYLELRLWIGLWTGAILIVMVALDLSAWVRYITRFTEESFALLISLIFIKEAFAKLFKVASTHPIHFFPEVFYPHDVCSHDIRCFPPNMTNSGVADNMTSYNVTTLPTKVSASVGYNLSNITTTPSILWWNLSQEDCVMNGGILAIPKCDATTRPEVFFFSVILFTGTFTLAMSLKMFRNTRFFPNFVRRIVSDFAVLIAILCMVALDLSLGIHTPKLEVPVEFKPTNHKTRGWVVPPVGKNPVWLIVAAVIPALLLTILIFMDQQITAVIVNRKENKLKKGYGYHLDLLIIALLIILNSFMGLPWFVAATVLSITHVVSLQKESECTAPGERPKFLGVREQRVTGVCIFLMIGISTVMTKVLRAIPMPVLYGVFLYMGISSLRGMQIVQRIMIWFSPAKYQPDYMYLRHVKTGRVHLFTAIQVFCLVLLWVIKSIKDTSIAFPIMVLAMCFIRKGMDKIFTQTELKWLDDVMPESHRRKKEDDEKKGEEMELEGAEVDGSVYVPVDGGNVLNITVQGITTSATDASFNISDEMAKTSLWKNMMNNDLNNKTSPSKPRKRNRGNRDYSPVDTLPTIPSSPTEMDQKDKKKEKKKPFFYIDEEEKEHLLQQKSPPPQIVVDPPSYERLSKAE